MADICTDNRFEVIKEYKQKLIECTNIETAQDEMAVIDDILFRFWQMGWIPVTQPERKQVEIEYTEWNEELWGASAICGNCGCTWQIANNGEDNFCPNCGTQMIRESEMAENRIDIWMDELPAVQPEIIRCGGCRWFGKIDDRFYRKNTCTNPRVGMKAGENDFCSYAEAGEAGE